MVPFTSDTARIRLAAGRVTGPGVAHRDRIRSRLPHAPVPRIARRVAAGPRRAGLAADAGPLHGRSRRAPARRADGSPAGHVRAASSISSATWRPRPAPRARTSTSCNRPTSGIGTVAAAPDGRRRRRHRVRQPARRHRAPRGRHRRGAAAARRDRNGDRCSASRGKARPTTSPSSSRSRGEVFGRSRRLSVRVSRRGVTVRARPEIMFVERAAARRRASPISDLLGSTDALPDLRLRVGGFTVRDPDGKLRVGVLVEPADAAVTLTSAGAILIDGNDRVVDALARPGRDRAPAPRRDGRRRRARIACASRRSTAPDGRRGGSGRSTPASRRSAALSLGSLLLGVSRGGTTSLQLEFGSEPTAHGVLRHLRRNRGTAAVGDARSGARPRRPARWPPCRSR